MVIRSISLAMGTILLPLFGWGQIDPDCFAEKDFLILHSTKDYRAALEVAQEASRSLHITLDLRGLVPDDDTLQGLTSPADTCLAYWGDLNDYQDSTCYVARGR